MAGPHDDRILTTITTHAASMLAVARSHSLCRDDALDAYQRALELYLRHVDEVRQATAGEWLRTVARNEAIRLRAQRQRLVSGDLVAMELRSDPDAREPAEHAVAMERVGHAAEALQGCKPDEATAILLKAGGESYRDIAARTGWSATKVNRVMTEGRRTFLQRFADIESGAACERYAGLLSAVADGEATPEDYLALRPHLRHCAGCRTTLAGLYQAQPALGALVPAAALGAGAAAAPAPELPVRLLGRVYEGLLTGLGDKLVRAQALIEAATTSKAGVVAATAAVAAGGAVAVGTSAPPAIPEAGPAMARTLGPPGQAAYAPPATTRRRARAAAAAGRGAASGAGAGTAGGADPPGGGRAGAAGAGSAGRGGSSGEDRSGAAGSGRSGTSGEDRSGASGNGRSSTSGEARSGASGTGRRSGTADGAGSRSAAGGGTADTGASSNGSAAGGTSGSGAPSGGSAGGGTSGSGGARPGPAAPAPTPAAPPVTTSAAAPAPGGGGEFGFEG